jgi:hypothetical protein
MMWLSETELQNLTKRVKPSAQVRVMLRQDRVQVQCQRPVRGAKTMKKDQ